MSQSTTIPDGFYRILYGTPDGRSLYLVFRVKTVNGDDGQRAILMKG